MTDQDERVEWWFEMHGERKYRLTRAEVLRDLDDCLGLLEDDAGPWAVGVSATLLTGEASDWPRTAEPEDPAAVFASSEQMASERARMAALAAERERSRRLVEELRAMAVQYGMAACHADGEPVRQAWGEAYCDIEAVLAEYEGGQTDGE